MSERGYKGKPVEALVEQISISEIDVDEQMLREHANDDDIIELANSIAKHGLWNPITLRPLENGRYQLVAGRRRITAHLALGASWIPAIIRRNLIGHVKGLALVENIQRRDLTLGEECDAITYLYNRENLSTDQICDLLGKTRSWVQRRLAIPNFPPEVVDAVLEGRVSLGAAEAIATVPEEGLREMLLNQTVQSSLTVAQVRAAVEVLKTSPSVEDAIEAGLAASPEQPTYVEPELECMACHAKAPISQLIMVRVHKQGCST